MRCMADSSKAQCFLCQYFLGFKRIKVITPGWLLKVNPVFYDPGEICDEIIAKADAAFRQLSDKEIEEINPNFPSSRMTKDSSTHRNSILHAVTSKETPSCARTVVGLR
jgi:hypothetical protein